MSLRNVISDIRQAGLDGRTFPVFDKISGSFVQRIEIKTGKDRQGKERCIGALLPSDSDQHDLFTRGLIEEARTQILKLSAGAPEPIGEKRKVSYKDVKLVVQ